ncbi:MAG: peptidase M15A [Desertifilum sp. SIO1I2]|nr:peptidase M15A [Desertifilum sp. SIO1I2]
MSKLSPDQRNYLYLLEAERVGIHKSILAALYQVQQQPTLSNGDKGLGISPANRIRLEEVSSFVGQVQYAANTLRAITDTLTSKGWQADNLWDASNGYHTRSFIEAIATGYTPTANIPAACQLEPCNAQALWQAYLNDLNTDFQFDKLPQNLAYLDSALLALIDRLPRFYSGLPHQRDALLELLRVWRKLDTRAAAIASLNVTSSSDSELDRALTQFAQNISRHYQGIPHQREALIRMTQLWRQLDSREAAIASLAQNTSPEPNLKQIDPALVAFVQRVPQFYQGTGIQRQALTEGFRLWRQLPERASALLALGLDAKLISVEADNPALLATVAAQLDRQLLDFMQRVPTAYQEQDHQREALIRLVQLWRNQITREQAINGLTEDLKRMNTAPRNTPEAPPPPLPIVLPRRPDRWTPSNIQIHASIIPNSVFTWAEATHGGTRMPPNQETVDAIVRIAQLAQQARDRIGRPFHVTSWYRPPDINARVGGVSNSRHIVGDAIDFYCDGLTGNQLYWFLDPWWPGGLGRYASYPYLSHIDARGYRARWLN